MKTLDRHIKFGLEALCSSGFCGLFFKRIIFWTCFFNICCDLPRNVKVISFSTRNSQTPFLENGLKMSTRRPPTEIFGESQLFYRKFVRKNFRGRGPKKSTILALFSKMNVRNFDQFGKNVFFVLPIFSKNRGNGRILLGVRPKIFLQKLMNVAHFVCKN